MQNIIIGKAKKMDFSTSEAYKGLRTNIQFCGKDVKVIAFTSCIPNEGKSSVVFNTARTIAESGKRVLFIDADMRKSVLTGRHRIRNAEKGLSHFLSGYEELDNVTCKTNIENFYMILAGTVPPNPSELIGSSRFKAMIKAAKEKFDYVLVDLPPIGRVTDAAVAAQACDGICLVIAANEISYKYAQKAKSDLEKGKCKILGVILNKVKIKKNGYYGRYYGRYYGKYYGSYYGKDKDEK